ncbi:hypothetical protein SBRCBS47491_001635 [Sporothrix bragantina]|uniref:Uncharacterized protein n=1 Tax=Sporothrix bragantina TaxID=671064 RepID=A0ABP0B093_9PEZI
MTRPPADGQGWVKTEEAKLRLRRIPFLANLRNKVLEPLQDQQKRGVTYDHILFLEDVLFHANDVQAFISTNQGNYVAACAVDVSKTPILYDTFALRDSDGHAPLMLRWPWFRSKTSREAALRGVPIPVQSCWNGMVAIRTEPFYPKNGQHFRGLPDSLASYHLEESKCCLIHADNAAMALPAPKNGGGVR